MSELIFLKFGGSLITEKDKVSTARLETLKRLAHEITEVQTKRPDMKLLLGHGSGSFGHVPAKKFNTRAGVKTAEEWAGFVEVLRQAGALNRIVVDALQEAGMKVMVFPPSAMVSAHDGKIEKWNIEPISKALNAGLLPVVYGDVVFDDARGGTILSTEDLFAYLAVQLRPKRILLAGDEEGVFADYPQRQKLISEITPKTYPNIVIKLGGSTATDVTGGMASKVLAMLDLVKQLPECSISIFSGMDPDTLQQALMGENVGTLLRAD